MVEISIVTFIAFGLSAFSLGVAIANYLHSRW